MDADALLAIMRQFPVGAVVRLKPGTLCCVAIGPDRPERLAPVTGALKVYR